MRSVMIAILVAVPSVALAGKKPSAAEAKKTAKAWLAALELGDDAPDAKKLVPMTAVPFIEASYHDEDPGCQASTTTSADTLADAFDCIHGIGEDVANGKIKPFAKKDIFGMMLDRAKGVLAIKDARFVEILTPCTGAQSYTIVAVVKDDAGAAKVAGIHSESVTCGE
jgi:hypothetical protein